MLHAVSHSTVLAGCSAVISEIWHGARLSGHVKSTSATPGVYLLNDSHSRPGRAGRVGRTAVGASGWHEPPLFFVGGIQPGNPRLSTEPANNMPIWRQDTGMDEQPDQHQSVFPAAVSADC